MRNLLLFIVIVMLLLPNSIGISQEITYSKYLTATITSSYVPLFVVGFVTTVAGLYKHNKLEEYSGNPDAIPDILPFIYESTLKRVI